METIMKAIMPESYIAKGFVHTKGDRSVGLASQEYTFELHRELLKDDESREWHRKDFQKIYRDVCDENCFVLFDDEQDDSSAILKKQLDANLKATKEIKFFNDAVMKTKNSI